MLDPLTDLDIPHEPGEPRFVVTSGSFVNGFAWAVCKSHAAAFAWVQWNQRLHPETKFIIEAW